MNTNTNFIKYYIVATGCRRPFIFQTLSYVGPKVKIGNIKGSCRQVSEKLDKKGFVIIAQLLRTNSITTDKIQF